MLSEYDDSELFEDQFIEDLLLNHNLSTQLFVLAGLPFLTFMCSTGYYYLELLSRNYDQDGQFVP